MYSPSLVYGLERPLTLRVDVQISYLGEVAGGVAPPAMPRRRHSDAEAVAHQSVADILCKHECQT